MVDTRQPVVRMSSITKQFLDVTASNKVDFDLYPGEICNLNHRGTENTEK